MKLSKKCQACKNSGCKEAGGFNYPCSCCKKYKYYEKRPPIKKRNKALVQQAERKATGADIHDVRTWISIYNENFNLLKSKDVARRARALGRINKAEMVLNLYINGKPIKEAIKEARLAYAMHNLR